MRENYEMYTYISLISSATTGDPPRPTTTHHCHPISVKKRVERQVQGYYRRQEDEREDQELLQRRRVKDAQALRSARMALDQEYAKEMRAQSMERGDEQSMYGVGGETFKDENATKLANALEAFNDTCSYKLFACGLERLGKEKGWVAG